jgi:hypothetical protein
VLRGGTWIELSAEEIERWGAAEFLPDLLQLAVERVDPAGDKEHFLLDDKGRLRGLNERQARALPRETWTRMLPPWIARRLSPKALDAAEQAILDRLLTERWPLLRKKAFEIADCSEHQFRRIWRHYPKGRKAPVGAPHGRRVPRKAPLFRPPR